MKYVLEGREVREAALGEWAAWLEAHAAECLIARTPIEEGTDVRTEFIGLERCIFETQVIGGPVDGESIRCRTYGGAEAAHVVLVELARSTLVRYPRRAR